METKIKVFFSKNSVLFSICFILIVCLILFFPYLVVNPTPLIFPVSDLGTDLNRDVLPNIEYIVNTIKTTGQIPLWRNYLLSGTPLAGHPSLPVFYPPYWLFLLLPVPLALNLLAFFNFSWMGIGMFFYLRLLGNKNLLPALFGAIAMALSPKWIAHLSGGHWFMLSALAWTPWALIGLGQFWNSKKVLWIFLLALSLASIAVNFLPYFIISSLALAFFSLGYLSKNNFLNEIKTMVLGWSIVIILTFGLVAGQILPMIELLPYAIHTIENSTFTSLNPIALLTAIFPPDLKYPEWFLFPGFIVLIFAGLSWAYGWTRFEIWGIIGLFGLVLSLGEFTPIYSLLFGWNELISVLRVPTRWWLLTIFALIVLSSTGINYWIENKQNLNQKAKLVVSFILLIEIVAGGLKIFLKDNFPFDTLPIMIISVFLGIILVTGHLRPRPYILGLIILLLIVELMVVGKSLIRPQNASFTGISKGIVSQIKSTIDRNERIFSPGGGFPALELVRSDLKTSEGYDALPLENYLNFIRLATGCPLVQEATGSQEEMEACLNPNEMRFEWLKIINVRYLVVQDGSFWNISELSPGLGRAFSVQEVVKTSNDHCLDDLKMINPLNVALVESEIIDHQNGTLKILNQERGINNEIFHVSVVDFPVLLLRSENWAPGWKAKVDGQPVNVLKVDCVLQGVWLETGEHSIEFYYQPFGYPLGFWIGVIIILSMIIWIFVEKLLLKRSVSLV